jgi:hypothetical protein
MTHTEMSVPSLAHLCRLTDDTGLLQFAVYSVPNPQSGYTLDDNARALLVASAYHFHGIERETAAQLVYRYLAFLNWAQLPDGRFHNIGSYDRHWLDEQGSEDSFGRALWALAYAVSRPVHRASAGAAAEMLSHALPHVRELQYARGQTYAILGLSHLIQAGHPSGDQQLLRKLTDGLMDHLQQHARSDWYWFEDVLTYDNGRLPQALIVAGDILKDDTCITSAKKTLAFLLSHVVENDIVVPIGQNGWFRRGEHKAYYDQQPIDAASITEVCATAFSVFHDFHYRHVAEAGWAWFHGRNSERLVLYDAETSGCHDGLGHGKINANQGAESTLALLQAALAVYELPPQE